jgi:hypothetical protein
VRRSKCMTSRASDQQDGNCLATSAPECVLPPDSQRAAAIGEAAVAGDCPGWSRRPPRCKWRKRRGDESSSGGSE